MMQSKRFDFFCNARLNLIGLIFVSFFLSIPAIAQEPLTFNYSASSRWSVSDFQRIDAPIGRNTDLGLTLDPQHHISELRLSFAFNQKLTNNPRDDSPIMFQLTLRGWKLMDTNLENGDTDFFERQRVRDRDVRKQWLMLSVSKTF